LMPGSTPRPQRDRRSARSLLGAGPISDIFGWARARLVEENPRDLASDLSIPIPRPLELA